MKKQPQISVIVVPVTFSSIAVIIVVFGIAYYFQNRSRYNYYILLKSIYYQVLSRLAQDSNFPFVNFGFRAMIYMTKSLNIFFLFKPIIRNYANFKCLKLKI